MSYCVSRRVSFDGHIAKITTFGEISKVVTGLDERCLDFRSAEACQTACFEIGNNHYLLLVKYDEKSDLWVLNEHAPACKLSSISEHRDTANHATFIDFANYFVRTLREQLFLDSPSPLKDMLQILGEDLAIEIANFAKKDVNLYSVADLKDHVEASAERPPERIKITVERLALSLESSAPTISDIAKYGKIVIPSLSQEVNVDAAYLIQAEGDSSVYRCIENNNTLCYYMIFESGRAKAIFFAKDNVIVIRDSFPQPSSFLSQLDRELVRLNFAGTGRVRPKAEATAIISWGLFHLGHVIWDELNCLDRFFNEAPADAPAPYLYFSPFGSALDLIGPIEDLYPEFRGKVFRHWNYRLQLAQAIEQGIEVVPRSDRRARHKTRERIQIVVDRDARRTGLVEKVRARVCDGRQRRTVVTFGLRLSNRFPLDMLGLYCRLSKTMSERFGPMTIIVDGISGNETGSSVASSVYNGASEGTESSPVDANAELSKELEWVKEFIDNVTCPDINVVNCVGMPLRQTLYWISQSEFFVAPWGNGVTKMRYAMDIPGILLTSQINLDHYFLLHAFDSDKWMEPPFQPLYFTLHEEVLDAHPLQEGEAPVLAGVPSPVSFTINEQRFTPRLLDIMAKHIHR